MKRSHSTAKSTYFEDLISLEPDTPASAHYCCEDK